MTRFSNDSIQFHGLLNTVAMSAAVSLRCLSQLTHRQGITTVGPNSGATYNETRFIGERKPEITATVAALETLFGTLSALGTNCMTADGTHPGVRAFLQSHNACAANARTSGSNHRRITVAKSQILITQFGGTVGQSASAQVRVVELSTDGSASPEAIVNNAALPSSPVDDEEFVIMAPTIEAIALSPEHVIGWQVDTGITLIVITGAGSIYPISVDIEKVAPRITIQHNDPALLASDKIPEDGIEITHANTLFPLRKRDPFGGLVALASTEHIEATAAGFAYHDNDYDASGSAVGTGQIIIECTEGVGGVPLTIATGQALA
jgi:hypothetical protein